MEYAAAASTLARRQAILAYMMPFMITFTVVGILIYIVSSLAMWNIFVKAGEKGWKGFIPFYNTYMLFKISWKVIWFWVCLILLIAVMILGNMRVNNSNFVIFTVIVLLMSVALLVINCIAMYKLSIAFGKGAGYAVGLFFLNVIFLVMLGFGKSKYELGEVRKDKIVVDESKFINAKNIKSKFSSKSSEAKAKPSVATTKKTNTKTATRKTKATSKSTTSKSTTSKSTTSKTTTSKTTAQTKTSQQKTKNKTARPKVESKPAKKVKDYIDPKQKIDF